MRLRREDYDCTRLDLPFSKWEILMGPSDWENHWHGKDGTERYRINNLPEYFFPGVYELGISTSSTDVGRNIDELDPSKIIVVYLGHADIVRTRLQQYGRAGSHLKRTDGFLTDIFLRGFPIVFRWVHMRNKEKAEKAESELLGAFDYAWNKRNNGARRWDDILLKLDKIASKKKRESNHCNCACHIGKE